MIEYRTVHVAVQRDNGDELDLLVEVRHFIDLVGDTWNHPDESECEIVSLHAGRSGNCYLKIDWDQWCSENNITPTEHKRLAQEAAYQVGKGER
jgi:hypothetical protein